MSNPNVAEVLKRLDVAREILKAKGEGKTLEFKGKDETKWNESTAYPAALARIIINGELEYRIKPEPLVMHAIVDKDGYVYPQTNEVSAQNAVLTWNHQSPGKDYRLVKMVEEIES